MSAEADTLKTVGSSCHNSTLKDEALKEDEDAQINGATVMVSFSLLFFLCFV